MVLRKPVSNRLWRSEELVWRCNSRWSQQDTQWPLEKHTLMGLLC